MKPGLLLLLFFLPFALCAQDEFDKPASKISQAYHKYRVHLSYPPYSFDKINLMIRKQVVEDSENNLVLKDKAYSALSLREKFTYNMLHAEWFSQNCDAMPPIQEEQTKIFGHLPDAFEEQSWSDRQIDFFKNNKDTVISLMKECIAKGNRVGVNFKMVIQEIKATEMIPVLIKTYNLTRKDHDILTVLMLLMKDSEYPPFLESPSYKKLYGDNADYQAILVYNKANEDLIIKRATDFYNGHKN